MCLIVSMIAWLEMGVKVVETRKDRVLLGLDIWLSSPRWEILCLAMHLVIYSTFNDKMFDSLSNFSSRTRSSGHVTLWDINYFPQYNHKTFMNPSQFYYYFFLQVKTFIYLFIVPSVNIQSYSRRLLRQIYLISRNI